MMERERKYFLFYPFVVQIPMNNHVTMIPISFFIIHTVNILTIRTLLKITKFTSLHRKE